MKSVAFHSYKGGTGKTTLAANLAAHLAKSGANVVLIDMDVYAPSLHIYFEKEPKRWLNDYLNVESIFAKDILYDLTPELVTEIGSAKGKLYVAFSNPRKDEVNKLEAGGQNNTRLQLLRRFVELREELATTQDAEYLVIDTSPGIRHWSINALALADTILLTLKMGDLDTTGTKRMAEEIYSSFTDFGAKSYLLMNRVAGFCVPNVRINEQVEKEVIGGLNHVAVTAYSQITHDSLDKLASDIGMDIISSIPCYCDIQFSTKEYLTILKYPDHPFSKQIIDLASDQHVRQ